MVASDGTYSGSTYFDPITNSSSDWYLMNTGDGHSPRRINAELNGYAFYGGDDSNGYFQLYKTDGTANGSTKVTNFSNGTELYEVSQYCKCIYGWVIGNTLYFQVNDVTTGNELWKTDGTTSGTKIVKDINVGSGDAFSSLNHDFHSIGDTLFFNANDGTHGIELWRTNGTESGTMMVEDFNPSGNSANSWILNAGTSILNMAYNGSEHVRSYDPANIGGVPSSFTGATCSISPALPTGLNIDTSTCTISGTPSVATSNTTYTVTANISGTVYEATVWLSSAYEQLTPSVEGADLTVGEAMEDITFQYDASASLPSTSSAFAYANDKISNGDQQTCAIADDGSLYCWGWGFYGELGHGAYTPLHAPSTTPVDLGAGRTAVAVAAGWYHTCAILDNGSVKCWGLDWRGQLGDGGTSHTGTTKINSPSAPIDLGANRTAVAISAGEGHTCAILDNGDMKCWGGNDAGQLGHGQGAGGADIVAPPSTAINLGTGRTAVAVSANNRATCALLDNGSVKCWGEGKTTGHLPPNTNWAQPSTAVNLGTGRTAASVSLGHHHACAILDTGDVKCWGRNTHGALGDGSTTATYTPNSTAIDLGSGRTAVAISSGDDFTCAILDNGEVKCWGHNDNGQLGDGSLTSLYAPNSTAIDLGTGRTAVAISTGEGHTCAILDNGDAKCWGADGGRLGDGGSGHLGVSTLPVLVAGSNTWDSSTGLSSGSGSGMTNVTGATCTVSPALPTGLNIDTSTCTISGTPSVATSNTTYNITADIGGTTYQGTIWLSSAYHQLTPSVEGADLTVGDLMDDITFQYDSSAASTSAFAYANDKMSTGDTHTCMILDNGDLKCWGNDGDGQLGDGGWGGDLNAPPSAAINLGTGRTAVAVSAGHATTCAILDNGELKCWGSDDGGQLGNGGSNTKIGSPPSTAIDLGMGRTAVAVSVGYAHTCAILDNGDLKCWGSNSYGVLGFSSSISSSLSSPPTSAIDLGSGRTAVAVSAAKYHTCAILDNGSMACWGRNNVGQLGDGTTTDRVTPALTNSLGAGRTAVALETGNNGPGGGAGHTCAILDNGDLKCWGSDAGGELGDGGTISALDYLDEPPTAAIDLGSGRTAVAVSAGAEHTCALLDNGEVKCWGKDDSGQLGDGGSFSSNNDGGISAPSSTAIDLGTGRTAVALDSGLSFSCAILDNGDAKCWGHDYYGQLGYGLWSTTVIDSAFENSRVRFALDRMHNSGVRNTRQFRFPAATHGIPALDRFLASPGLPPAQFHLHYQPD